MHTWCRIVCLAAILATTLSYHGALFARPDCDIPDPPPACNDPEPPIAGSLRGELSIVRRAPNGVAVSGSAVDPDAPGVVAVDILRTGQTIAHLLSNENNGTFSGTVSVPNGRQESCAIARNRNGGEDTPIGCHTVDVTDKPPDIPGG